MWISCVYLACAHQTLSIAIINGCIRRKVNKANWWRQQQHLREESRINIHTQFLGMTSELYSMVLARAHKLYDWIKRSENGTKRPVLLKCRMPSIHMLFRVIWIFLLIVDQFQVVYTKNKCAKIVKLLFVSLYTREPFVSTRFYVKPQIKNENEVSSWTKTAYCFYLFRT